MVAERAASPEPVATVIDDVHEVTTAHRPSSNNPRLTTSVRRGGGSPFIGLRSNCSSSSLRQVSFETSSLVENYASYKASGPPSRVLYYGAASAWVDFTGEALAVLRRAFDAGRTSVELLNSERGEKPKPTVVDFLRMLQTDLDSGRERSVGWIDAQGRCFFPKRAVGGAEERGGLGGSRMLEIDVLSKYVAPPPLTIPSSLLPFGAAVANLGGARKAEEAMTSRWDESGAVQSIDRAADYYKHVERVFLAGIQRVLPDAAVTAIRRCTHAGAHGGARLRAFVSQAQFTKTIRSGEANVRAAWYPAATPDQVDEIVRYGFGAPNCDKFGDRRYGNGVYLIPPQALHFHPPSSCVLSAPDVNGERHLLLCRVIVGSMEKVELGSRQSRPSGDQFDTGADDPDNPRLHVVWSTKMNTHIIPECVVTFRCSGFVPKQQAAATRKPVLERRPSHSIPLTFLQLYAEIRKFVPPSTMRTLDALLERYKARKIPKDAFIKYLRSIAGTGVLAETINKFKNRLL